MSPLSNFRISSSKLSNAGVAVGSVNVFVNVGLGPLLPLDDALLETAVTRVEGAADKDDAVVIGSISTDEVPVTR